jgi:hypothetical protein
MKQSKFITFITGVFGLGDDSDDHYACQKLNSVEILFQILINGTKRWLQILLKIN